MSEELTTAAAAERLDTPERTIRLWCKQGKFQGARAVETPRGSYWMIPSRDLEGFQKPTLGRPPRPKPESAAKKSKKTRAA